MKLNYLRLRIIIVISCIITHGSLSGAPPLNEESFTLLCSEWPPFEYTDKDGEPTGYSVEVLQAVLKELDIPDNIQIYPWYRAYKISQSKKNTLIFTLARTKSRENLFKWVGPIAPRDMYLWKLKNRKDVTVENWDDLKEYMIGTVKGEAAEKQLLAKGFRIHKNISPVTKQIQNYHMLYAKRIDFVYGLELSTIFGLEQAGLNPDKIERSLLLDTGLEYYYGFSNETSDGVVDQFRAALKRVKENGIYDMITSKYSNKN